MWKWFTGLFFWIYYTFFITKFNGKQWWFENKKKLKYVSGIYSGYYIFNSEKAWIRTINLYQISCSRFCEKCKLILVSICGLCHPLDGNERTNPNIINRVSYPKIVKLQLSLRIGDEVSHICC